MYSSRWSSSEYSTLYAAIPAIIVTVRAILYVDAGAITGSVLEVDVVVWVVAALVTVTIAPFAILVASVLRIGAVARRTLAIGPFIRRDTDRSAEIDRDDP